MKFNFLADTWRGMIKTSVFLLGSNLLLAFATLFLAYKLLDKEPVVAIVPPQLTKEAKVSMNSADAEYLMSFGLYIATLTGNITPKNVVFVTDAISSLVDARLYPSIRRQLFSLAENPVFKERGGSIYFEPLDVSVDVPTGKVFIKGNQVAQKTTGLPTRLPYVYEIQLEIRERQPYVISFDKYEGRVERSLQWEEKNKRTIERDNKRKKDSDNEEVDPWFEEKVFYTVDPEDELEQENNIEFDGEEK